MTNNILLCSRKIQFWHFKTQEQIRTSHENSVAFALYNTKFESVVSADDDGYIALWDIENGKLMSKFGDAHGPQQKVTCGTFDMFQRRLVTSGEDGSCKIWNFSNGHSLKNLLTEEKKDPGQKKRRSEYTQLVAVHDEDKLDKMAHFVAVGWDRRLHIWDDDRESEAENVKEHAHKSDPGIDGHCDDIMSATYDVRTNLIFTGGHDGTLLAWHFETGFVKFHLHEMDKTCLSKDYIRESKSVDCLHIMHRQRILLSGCADQSIRFWDLNDLSSGKQPLFKFTNMHEQKEALTALAVDSRDEKLVTADTMGRFKLWDISQGNWRSGHSSEEIQKRIRLCWYVQAHRSAVNTLQIVETYREEVDLFIVSAGADWNILLHRMSNGAKIGQFSQDATWNIRTLNQNKKQYRPNYVRDWFEEKKAAWKRFFNQRIQEAREKGLLQEQEELKPRHMEARRLMELGFTDAEGNLSLHDSGSDQEIAYEDFSSEEEDPQKDLKGVPLQQYPNHKRFGAKAGGTDVGESKYFNAIIN